MTCRDMRAICINDHYHDAFRKLEVRLCRSNELQSISVGVKILRLCVASAVVVQPLPTLNSVNQSLFLVYAGYQDYFYSLYDETLTPRQTLNIVEEVVESIGTHIEVIYISS